MKFVRPLILLLLMTGACSSSDEFEIPESIRGLKNLTVYSTNPEHPFRIRFVEERRFGDSEEIVIGSVSGFSVDDSGRVLIADGLQNQIHLFGRSGRYQTSIGQQGSGPGDFQAIGTMSIAGEQLFVYDPRLTRLNQFSLNSLAYQQSYLVYPANQRQFEELKDRQFSSILFINENRFLARFSSIVFSDPSQPGYNLNDRMHAYYLTDNEGRFLSDKLFEKPAYRALTATVDGEFRFTQFEFLGVTLLTVSENDHLHVVETNEFLVQVYDAEGRYLRAFFYPFQKREFSREDAIEMQEYEEKSVLEWRTSVIRGASGAQIPETWPALNDLVIDGENRLWVSTIVEDFDIYEWYVLEETGELITKFEWPRNEPIEVVRNGYMYTREMDEETGLQTVVRYRIEMEER